MMAILNRPNCLHKYTGSSQGLEETSKGKAGPAWLMKAGYVPVVEVLLSKDSWRCCCSIACLEHGFRKDPVLVLTHKKRLPGMNYASFPN